MTLPSPDSFDAITAEIVVSQRWTLPQHYCKTLRPRERLGMSFVQLGCLGFVCTGLAGWTLRSVFPPTFLCGPRIRLFWLRRFV